MKGFYRNKILWQWVGYGALVFVIIGIFTMGVFAFWISSMQIPNLNAFEQRRVEQSTKIYDRTGEILLYDVFRDSKRTVVPFEDISEHIKNATISIEDSGFYEHNGIEPRAILRAMWVNLTDQEFSQGGSTITQQVIKNSVLTPEKEISRKIKEWVFAIRLEQVMGKDEILHFYLNEAPYGGTIYGVEQASQSFFGKSAAEVTPAEAAYLAALPVSPSYLSPHGSNTELLEARKNLILREMVGNGFLTEEEYTQALEEEVEFLPQTQSGIKAPHFVMYVLEYLEQEYGRDTLEQNGLEVITTLDYELQQKAEEIVYTHAMSNKDRFDAENAGLVSVDPTTGEILVMVGSRDYFDQEIPGNFNVTTAKRQPGSAFKPFAYAEAFNKGYTAETILFDLRTQFSTACSPRNLTSEGGCYSPRNYTGRFEGPVTMREALAQSINVPAVKTLYLAGLSDTAELAVSMGVDDLTDLDRYGLTMVLGGGEVELLDMTSAYGVFANDGVRNPHTAILKVTDSNNEVFEEFEQNEERVLEERTARLISDILSDNVARAPLFGTNSLMNFPNRDVAVKTGTTNNYKDAWVIGYTPTLAVGAWAGNNDNRSMNQEIAGLIISPLWREFMDVALPEFPNERFKTPPEENREELKPVLRGEWRGRSTEHTQNENGEDMMVGGVHSILHWVNRSNPRGPIPSNPGNDGQYELWETPVRTWVGSQDIQETNPDSIPTDGGDINTSGAQPEIKIQSPEDGDEMDESEEITIRFSYSGEFPQEQVVIQINGNEVRRVESDTSRVRLFLDELDLDDGEYELTVVVFDEKMNRGEDSVDITIE